MEDGSEIHCRWCGQGGTIYGCAVCPYVFCSTCITSNLSEAVLDNIKQDDNWRCFRCHQEPIRQLQARHWALWNFMQKQIKEIKTMKATEVEKDELRKMDSSTCCAISKRATESRPSLKRKPSNVDQPAGSSDEKKSKTVVKVDKIASNPAGSSPSINSNPSTRIADSKVPSLPATPAEPPVATKPIFQMLRGLQVDLNAASMMDNFTFPDGLVIKVTKKKSVGIATSLSDFKIVKIQAKPKVTKPTTFELQDGVIKFTRGAHPNTPLGRSMTEFEDNLIQCFAISLDSTNKLMTLSRTDRFKSPANMLDAKCLFEDLKTRVSYMNEKLATLSQNVDKGMQKVMENIPVMEASEDVYIVEDAVDVVDLLSDNEEVPEI